MQRGIPAISMGGGPRKGTMPLPGSPEQGAKLHSIAGRLFPIGNGMDALNVQDLGKITLTVIDAANPVALVSAKTLGLIGTEIETIDSSETIRGQFEAIRSRTVVLFGLASTPEEVQQHRQRHFKKRAVDCVPTVAR